MSRIRYIKPDFFTDEDLGCISIQARLFYAGLWCHADRDGRLEYRPQRLKVLIMPYDNVDIEQLCAILSNPKIPHRPTKRFIDIYDVDGEKYIEILNLQKHQNFHKGEKSKGFPSKHGASTVPAPCQHGASTTGTGTGIGTENGLPSEPSSPQEQEPPTDLASHTFVRFLEVMPLRSGRCLQESECKDEWARAPANWNQLIAAAKHYAASREVADGMVMHTLKFIRHRWKDWLVPETGPSVPAPPYNTAWQEENKLDTIKAEEARQSGATARGIAEVRKAINALGR